MQGCLLVDSHKSSGSGPVHSPVSCPSKKKHKPKAKETEQTKNTQPQPNQNKQKHRSGIATSYGNNMHDDILCVIVRMATEQEAKQRKLFTSRFVRVIPCAGATLIFSVSFQFYRMIPEGNPRSGFKTTHAGNKGFEQGRPQLHLQKSYQFQVQKMNPKTSLLYLLVLIMTTFPFLLC